MAVQEPYVKVYTYDYSQISPRVIDDLNIGLCVNTQTGPLGPEKVSSLGKFIERYLTNNKLTATDDITVKSAAKILQFAPVFITRAFGSRVLPGMTNNGDTFFTDTEYNYFNKSYQIKLDKKVNAKYFIGIQYTDDKGAETKYLLYQGEDAPDFTSETRLVWNELGSYNPVQVDTDKAFSGSFFEFLKKVNDNSNVRNKMYINKTGDYISVTMEPGYKIIDYPKFVENFSANVTETKRIGFISSTILDTNKITKDDYLYINGATYYIGDGNDNVEYQGKQVNITPYTGNYLQGSINHTNYFNNIDPRAFMIYLKNEIVKNDSIKFVKSTGGFEITIDPNNSLTHRLDLVSTDEEFIEKIGKDYNYATSDSNGSIIVKLDNPDLIVPDKFGIVIKSYKEVSGEYKLVKFTMMHNGYSSNEINALKKFITIGDVNHDLEEIDTDKAPDAIYNIGSSIKTLEMFVYRLYEWVTRYDEKRTDINNLHSKGTYDFSGISGKCKFDENDEYTISYTSNELNSVNYLINNSSVQKNFIDENEGIIYYYSMTDTAINEDSARINNFYVKVYTGDKQLNSSGNVQFKDMSLDKLKDNELIGPNGEDVGSCPYVLDYDNKYVFYVGRYTTSDPDEELIKLSNVGLTFNQFLKRFRTEVAARFKVSYSDMGVTFFDYDGVRCYDVIINSRTGTQNNYVYMVREDSNGNKIKDDMRYTDYSLIKRTNTFGIVSKFCNKDKICSFSYERKDNDPELYSLTLSRKNDPTVYTISMYPDKLNESGISAYYTNVNKNSDYYQIIGLNEEVEPAESFTSLMWGNEVPVIEPDASDYVTGFDRYRKFNGYYYDFFFDGGYVSPVLASALNNLGQDLYSQALITLQDVYDPAQVIDYRNNTGIDHWEGKCAVPLTIDTTIGSFLTYTSPMLGYLERIYLNKNTGKEFAPVFGITNGVCNYTPKYTYEEVEEEREKLLNSQINTVIWDEARQLAYFNLDLTMQKSDTTLSDGNCVRMINASAHICDYNMQQFIGQFNTVDTRRVVTSTLEYALEQRLMTNQAYTPVEVKVVCNETNNTNEIIERRELVVDVYFRLQNGIRYIHVYQRVYSIGTDLSSVVQ